MSVYVVPFSGAEPRATRESTKGPRRRTEKEKEASCLETKSIGMKDEVFYFAFYLKCKKQIFIYLYLFPFITA